MGVIHMEMLTRAARSDQKWKKKKVQMFKHQADEMLPFPHFPFPFPTSALADVTILPPQTASQKAASGLMAVWDVSSEGQVSRSTFSSFSLLEELYCILCHLGR